MNQSAYYSGHGSTVNAIRNPDQERTLPAMATRFVPDYPQSTQPPKIITCTDGSEVLVDADDYPILSRHSWYINYSKEKPYCITKLKTDQSTIWRCIFMHHMILGGGSQTDHRDGNTLNNQKHNLRPASHQQNGWNKGAPNRKDRKSRFKGVRPAATKQQPNRWQAYLKAVKPGAHKSTGKMIYSGFYDSEEDAARAYNAMALETRGEWTWFNPVEPKFPISAKSNVDNPKPTLDKGISPTSTLDKHPGGEK